MRKKLCKIHSCNTPAYCRGWCQKHYRRWMDHGDPFGGGTFQGAPRVFLQKAIHHSGDGCLTWPYAVSGNGYGQIMQKGQPKSVTRLICTAVYGPPPSNNHQVAHSCGNGHRACCNPSHLRWATAKENSADRLIHGTDSCGERQINSKLTNEMVRAIRADKRKLRQIAATYGISVSHAGNIKTGLKWKESQC